MSEITVRPAKEADLPAILAIYNDAVTNTTAIWNERLSDLQGRRDWWQDRIAQGFPVFVAELDGVCVGYATYGHFRPNDGYKHSRELSVYVAAEQRGKGIASTLMDALEEHARAHEVHVLIGGLEAENTASLALHAKHGFTRAGHLRHVGRKFDRWLDLVLMQKVLD
ncbi:MAG: N-acetyltransferase family protein [Hyphomicrobiales bacterium]|jgi:L-amino acid N-acyltransferase YncA